MLKYSVLYRLLLVATLDFSGLTSTTALRRFQPFAIDTLWQQHSIETGSMLLAWYTIDKWVSVTVLVTELISHGHVKCHSYTLPIQPKFNFNLVSKSLFPYQDPVAKNLYVGRPARWWSLYRGFAKWYSAVHLGRCCRGLERLQKHQQHSRLPS